METKHNMKLSFINWIRRIFASLFFIGYFPFGSGTIASALVVVALWFTRDTTAVFFGGPHGYVYYWIAMLVLIAISCFLSSKSREAFGTEDAPQVVIDEIAGQFIVFFLVPLTLKTLILGFLLFRFFDIVKPFPVYVMEDMEEGVGVTMDDVAAGVLANVSLLIILALYHAVRAYL